MTNYLMKKMLSKLILASICIGIFLSIGTSVALDLAKGFKDAEQFVHEHVGGNNPTDPYAYGDKVRELMDTSWRYSSDVNAAMKLYSDLSKVNSPEENLEYTCNSATLELIKAIRKAAQASGTVNSTDYKTMQSMSSLPYKLAAEIVREHSGKCQRVYEKRFENEADDDERKDGETFGRHFIGHLLSLERFKDFCSSTDGLDACLQSHSVKLISSLDTLTDEQATLTVYNMLLKEAEDDANRGALRTVGVPVKKSKGFNKLRALFAKCFIGDGHLDDKHKITVKLPCNQAFNELYNKYIVSQCKYIVTELGPEMLAQVEYERRYLLDQFDPREHSTQFLYSWLAYSACKQIILNPDHLQSFPTVVELAG